MEIVKRPSGGRGEYEIAGTYGSLSPTDLESHELVIELGGTYGNLRTGIQPLTQGGKLRLRRMPGDSRRIQFQRQIEALLLMPKSIREEGQLIGGQPVVLENRYVLRRIQLRTVTRTLTDAVVTVDRVECDNRSAVEEIDFSQRFGVIQQLHRNAAQFPPPIRDLLERHRTLISGQHPLTTEAEKLVTDLMTAAEDVSADYNKEYGAQLDVLPLLRELLQLPQIERPPVIEAIDPQDVELRRREAARWRQYVATRGAAGAKFRRDVIRAYDSTCLMCGVRLPKSTACRVPGVDAAHILPWAEYDLDIVSNGLCLCKLHHWAFDQMLIAVRPATGGYIIRVTDIAERAFGIGSHTLAQLRTLEGPVPKARLPANAAEWPHKQLLIKLYEDMELKD